MMQRVVSWLSYSPVQPLARVFSGSARGYLESDPDEQQGIIDDVERRVYGREGLDAYERREPRQIARAARRSLAQHLGQRAEYRRRSERVVRWASFALLTPFLGAFLIADTLRQLARGRPTTTPSETVIFFWAQRLEKFVWPEMFPGRTVVLHESRESCLGWRELAFFARVVFTVPAALLYPEFISNVLRWLGHYGYARRAYRPTLVGNFFESTAASSLITAYLNAHGIEHCDIQHGELRFTAHCAFAEFNRYRLWGEHSRDLLVRQRSPGDRMQVVSVPFHRELFTTVRPGLQPRPKRLLIIDPFLHDEWSHDDAFLAIFRGLDASWEIRMRRHPADQRPTNPSVERWNADAELQRLGIRIEEERPRDVTIVDALARSRVVAGVSSAALLEAWIAGCKVLYVPGGPRRSAVMDRHRHSPNVRYLDEGADLRAFFAEPAVLDAEEAARVNYISAVLT